MTTYKGVKLSSYERSQLQKYMQMTTLRAKLADMMRPNGSWRQDLNKYKAQGLRSSQGYKLYEQRFYADVSRVFSEAKNEAMDMLFTNNPRLAAQIELRLRQREISRTGDYDDVNYLINEFPR